MYTSNLPRIVAVFVALLVAGIVLIVFGVSASQEIVSGVLPLVGVGMFTSALTFFLIAVVRLPEHK